MGGASGSCLGSLRPLQFHASSNQPQVRLSTYSWWAHTHTCKQPSVQINTCRKQHSCRQNQHQQTYPVALSGWSTCRRISEPIYVQCSYPSKGPRCSAFLVADLGFPRWLALAHTTAQCLQPHCACCYRPPHSDTHMPPPFHSTVSGFRHSDYAVTDPSIPLSPVVSHWLESKRWEKQTEMRKWVSRSIPRSYSLSNSWPGYPGPSGSQNFQLSPLETYTHGQHRPVALLQYLASQAT